MVLYIPNIMDVQIEDYRSQDRALGHAVRYRFVIGYGSPESTSQVSAFEVVLNYFNDIVGNVLILKFLDEALVVDRVEGLR